MVVGETGAEEEVASSSSASSIGSDNVVVEVGFGLRMSSSAMVDNISSIGLVNVMSETRFWLRGSERSEDVGTDGGDVMVELSSTRFERVGV